MDDVLEMLEKLQKDFSINVDHLRRYQLLVDPAAKARIENLENIFAKLLVILLTDIEDPDAN
jgi:ribosome recycling factor